MSHEKLQQLYLIIQIVGYVVGTGVVSVIIRGIYRTYKNISSVCSLIPFLEHELKPNSGQSARDAINRIENKLNYLSFAQRAYWDNNTDKAMFQTDGKGVCVWVNKSMCDLVNKQIVDFLGTAWEIIVEQSQRSLVRSEWFRAVEEQRPFDMTYNLIHANGKVITVRCTASGSVQTGYVGFIEKLRVKGQKSENFPDEPPPKTV